MIRDRALLENHYNTFQSLLRQSFPEGRAERIPLADLTASIYQFAADEQTVIGLIDHKQHRTVYLSENFERVTGISRDTFFGWKSRYMFGLLTVDHFSYPYRAVSEGLKFFYQLDRAERYRIKRFAAGMKIKDGAGRIRQIFSKAKVLTLDEKNKLDISIYFIQDISHLVKGDVYWIRHAAPNKSSCFIKQKGKQHFEDLLTDREKQITQLLAEHLTSNEIAEKLFLSTGTVEKHRKNMLKKVGAVNSTALVHLCKMAEVI